METKNKQNVIYVTYKLKKEKEIKTMDLNKIKEAAQGYEKDMTAFLRAIVKNPEKAVMRELISKQSLPK